MTHKIKFGLFSLLISFVIYPAWAMKRSREETKEEKSITTKIIKKIKETEYKKSNRVKSLKELVFTQLIKYFKQKPSIVFKLYPKKLVPLAEAYAKLPIELQDEFNNYRSRFNNTVLHYLSTTSDLQAFILSNIYNNTMDNITAVNNDGQNAFHHCIAHGKQKRAIAFLEVMETLSNNASPIPLLSNYDKFNKSPLLTALQHNYEMVARKIIAILGDDIQLQLEDNEIGENALGISLKKFPELGVSLIQKGATLWFEDLLIIVDFKKPHNFKRMYEAGFDFNQNFHPNDLEGNNNESEVPEAFSEDPFNILFVAILYNPKNIHHIVHQGSADVNCTTAENGLSALQFACIHGQREAVKKLIKCEADINYKENLNYSALTFALENIPTHDHYQYNNYVKIIKLLLRKGATITLNDLTINHSNVEITSLLQENYKKQTH